MTLTTIRRHSNTALLFALLLSPQLRAIAQMSGQASVPAASAATSSENSILSATEAAKIMPATVFFRGQSAPVQARNSTGLRLGPDSLLLAAMVDTSGYSNALQQKYQAYLLTESPIDIEGTHLPAGAYGFGFIAGDKFIVMDVGSHDLFTVASTRDADIRRPTPLKILAAPNSSTTFRLYAGRNYVTFTPSK